MYATILLPLRPTAPMQGEHHIFVAKRKHLILLMSLVGQCSLISGTWRRVRLANTIGSDMSCHFSVGLLLRLHVLSLQVGVFAAQQLHLHLNKGTGPARTSFQ